MTHTQADVLREYNYEPATGLIAAVNAAAQATFEAARANPVRITWGRCTYRFAEGVHATRAEQLVRDIRHVVSARGVA